MSPFHFTIWIFHSIDEIKRYADRVVHNNCSTPTRHSPFFRILHFRDRSGRMVGSMFSGDSRTSSASDDLPGGSKCQGWMPVKGCPILSGASHCKSSATSETIGRKGSEETAVDLVHCSTPVTSRHVINKSKRQWRKIEWAANWTGWYYK